ncbi:hypothetical protein CGCVW01_v010256 [Colletotrichum viniferum]|nr:hypothetical protein CGCVW01_v010256 [Colletotrichum viniferum]
MRRRRSSSSSSSSSRRKEPKSLALHPSHCARLIPSSSRPSPSTIRRFSSHGWPMPCYPVPASPWVRPIPQDSHHPASPSSGAANPTMAGRWTDSISISTSSGVCISVASAGRLREYRQAAA